MHVTPTAEQEVNYNSLSLWNREEGNKEQGRMVTGQKHWYTLWLFGIVLDDDGDWYVPSDYDDVDLITIDNPPQGAWDARPV